MPDFPHRGDGLAAVGALVSGTVVASGTDGPTVSLRMDDASWLFSRISRLMMEARKRATDADDPVARCPALLGASPAVHRARSAVRVAGRTSTGVLVMRERGCLGQDVARAIHDAGEHPRMAFLGIESDATDASFVSRLVANPSRIVADRLGVSDGTAATVFLDRVECLPPKDQAKLAEAFCLGRIGSANSPVLLIAGTLDDLRARVSAGRFRQDLYYYLAVVIVEIPPLRTRLEDVPLLLSHFLQEAATSFGRPLPRIPRRVVELCENYHWPGNLRELQCVAERLFTSSPSSRLDANVLPDEIRYPKPPNHSAFSFELPPEGLKLNDLERYLIAQALELHSGNRTRAARMLGLSRQTLLYRMQKFGLR